MKKSDLVSGLMEKRSSLNHRQAEAVVNTIFESMTDAMSEGDRIGSVQACCRYSLGRQQEHKPRNGCRRVGLGLPTIP